MIPIPPSQSLKLSLEITLDFQTYERILWRARLTGFPVNHLIRSYIQYGLSRDEELWNRGNSPIADFKEMDAGNLGNVESEVLN